MSVHKKFQIACISVVICTICVDLVKPSQSKKNKKKAAESKYKDVILELQTGLKEHLSSLDCALENWKAMSDEQQLQINFEMLNLNGMKEREKEVLDNLVKSHESAVKELQTVLKGKSKQLNGILA